MWKEEWTSNFSQTERLVILVCRAPTLQPRCNTGPSRAGTEALGWGLSQLPSIQPTIQSGQYAFSYVSRPRKDSLWRARLRMVLSYALLSFFKNLSSWSCDSSSLCSIPALASAGQNPDLRLLPVTIVVADGSPPTASCGSSSSSSKITRPA